jgi:uncharacterized membrane protein YcaP (DUF421 family)
MEKLFEIDWRVMFVPETSVLEMVVRGTLMYLGIFVLLRIFRRQAGTVNVADLIVIVIIADAAQNGMAGESKSVVEALVLIITIIVWDYVIDWLGFKSPLLEKVLEPPALVLVKNGRMVRRNMDREMLTEEELLGQLRQQGIDDISEVKECRLESSGDFSVIRKSGRPNHGNKKKKDGVS